MAERIANAGRKNMLVDKTSYMDLNRNFQLPGTSSPRRSRRGCLRNLAPTTWSLWTEAPIISWRVFGSKKCPGNRSYESTVVSKHVDFPVNRIDRRYARVLMERMTLYSNRGQWLWRLILVRIHCSSSSRESAGLLGQSKQFPDSQYHSPFLMMPCLDPHWPSWRSS